MSKSSSKKKSNEGVSLAIARFEALVLELNRAIFQFGLFLPPLVMWEEAFSRLNPVEIKYATDLLQVMYSHVHHPDLLFSNYYISPGQWERIKRHDPANDVFITEDLLQDMFKQDFSLMDKTIFEQSISFFNLRKREELAVFLWLYVDYLGTLQKALSKIAWENHHIMICEGFMPEKKFYVGYDLDKLKQVADFLIEEECIESAAKDDFLALFGNVFMKNDIVIHWIKKAPSHATSVGYLKEVFVVLGVDMEDKLNRDTIEICFRGIGGEKITIPTKGKGRKRTKLIEQFSSRLQKVLGI